jgi:hypothetical protein
MKMKKMKINSKNDYRRDRVHRGYLPHRIHEMMREQALENKKER